jgi:hypothetical protein
VSTDCDKSNGQVTAKWGDKSLSARGNQVIGVILGLVIAGLLSWSVAVTHAHDDRESKAKAELLMALRDIAAVARDQVSATRESTDTQDRTRRELACLLRLEQKNRAAVCSEISK